MNCMQRKCISAVLWQHSIKHQPIGPSNMQDHPTGFSQALSNTHTRLPSTRSLIQHFPKFHYRTSYFCCLPFSSLQPFKPPPKDIQELNRSWQTSSNVIFLEIALFALSLLEQPACSFNRPWYPSFKGIRASRALYIKNFFFDGHPIFPHLVSQQKASQKNIYFQQYPTHPTTTTTHTHTHPTSIPQNNSRRNMNPVIRNFLTNFLRITRSKKIQKDSVHPWCQTRKSWTHLAFLFSWLKSGVRCKFVFSPPIKHKD